MSIEKALPFIDQCSDSERVFCETYAITLSKTRAAQAMGTESTQPSVIGWQVYQRAHVQGYIRELLDAETLSKKETLKLISDTARSNISDYMNPVQKLHIPKVKKGLQEIIDHLQYEVEIETEFLSTAPDLTKGEKESSELSIRSKELEIVRYDIELNKNPHAYRIVDGDAQLVEEMELDLFAIAKDKAKGKIKSFKHTKDGIQVELHDADANKDRLARIHGLYEKDNAQASERIHSTKEHKRTVEDYSTKFTPEVPGEGL